MLQANNTGSQRSVTLNVVASSGNATTTVTIMQRLNEPLAITNFSPDHGPANTIVTINGTGFDPNPAGDSVFFNGKAATIISASSNSIVAKVPVGAGSGNVSVKVNNSIVIGQVFTYETAITRLVIAGTGSAGTANGTGTAASFALPTGITIDPSGNIYVMELAASTVRKITPAAVVSTFAGKSFTQGNQDGTGSGALFDYANDIAADKTGNVFLADYDNNNIRKITPAGVVTTFIPGGMSSPTGIAVDAQNYVYVASPSDVKVRKISPSGMITNVGTGNNSDEIYDVTVDQNGNLFVCDRGTNMIRKISPSGVVTDIAGIWHVSGMTNGQGNTATFKRPSSIAVDNNGNIYVADVGNNAIRKINSSGVVSTYLANAAAYTTDANFFGSYGVAVDKDGIVYITNTEHRIVKIIEQ
jgi:streptogramin lyase